MPKILSLPHPLRDGKFPPQEEGRGRAWLNLFGRWISSTAVADAQGGGLWNGAVKNYIRSLCGPRNNRSKLNARPWRDERWRAVFSVSSARVSRASISRDWLSGAIVTRRLSRKTDATASF